MAPGRVSRHHPSLPLMPFILIACGSLRYMAPPGVRSPLCPSLFRELGNKDGILAHFSRSPTAVLQGPLDATLDYPMYYKLKNAFQSKQTMKNIHNGVAQNSVFHDTSVLATFVDNHDNPRFISENSDWTTLKNALAYIMFAQASAWREGGREGFNVLLVVGTRTIPSLPLSQGEVQHEASITGGGEGEGML